MQLQLLENCYQNMVAGGRFNALATARIDLLPITCSELRVTAKHRSVARDETLRDLRSERLGMGVCLVFSAHDDPGSIG